MLSSAAAVEDLRLRCKNRPSELAAAIDIILSISRSSHLQRFGPADSSEGLGGWYREIGPAYLAHKGHSKATSIRAFKHLVEMDLIRRVSPYEIDVDLGIRFRDLKPGQKRHGSHYLLSDEQMATVHGMADIFRPKSDGLLLDAGVCRVVYKRGRSARVDCSECGSKRAMILNPRCAYCFACSATLPWTGDPTPGSQVLIHHRLGQNTASSKISQTHGPNTRTGGGAGVEVVQERRPDPEKRSPSKRSPSRIFKPAKDKQLEPIPSYQDVLAGISKVLLSKASLGRMDGQIVRNTVRLGPDGKREKGSSYQVGHWDLLAALRRDEELASKSQGKELPAELPERFCSVDPAIREEGNQSAFRRSAIRVLAFDLDGQGDTPTEYAWFAEYGDAILRMVRRDKLLRRLLSDKRLAVTMTNPKDGNLQVMLWLRKAWVPEALAPGEVLDVLHRYLAARIVLLAHRLGAKGLRADAGYRSQWIRRPGPRIAKDGTRTWCRLMWSAGASLAKKRRSNAKNKAG